MTIEGQTRKMPGIPCHFTDNAANYRKWKLLFYFSATFNFSFLHYTVSFPLDSDKLPPKYSL